MGVLDKFLDIMKLSDDYDDDDFYDDDYYDDDYDDKPAKKNLLSRIKDTFGGDEDDYEEDYDDRPAKSGRIGSGNKVTPMRQPAKKIHPGMEVCVIRPTAVEDSREITETLITGRTVILNLEGLDLDIAQRIIDFTSGAAFAISGNLQKISNYIFLVTPTNVDISGDLQNLLGGSFDSSPMGGRY